jgi:hypothetical protein
VLWQDRRGYPRSSALGPGVIMDQITTAVLAALGQLKPAVKDA